MGRTIAAAILVLTGCSLQAANLPLNTLRIWHNQEDQAQLEARCLWVKSDRLYLEPLEGKVEVWSLDALAEEDQAFLASYLQYRDELHQPDELSSLDIPFTVYVAELKGAFWFPFCFSCSMVFSLASTLAGRQWWLAFTSLSAVTSAFMGICFIC